jgi:cobalamin biosynthesis Co2+ chelatase CbiK
MTMQSSARADIRPAREEVEKRLQRMLNRIAKARPPLKQQQVDLLMQTGTKQRYEERLARVDHQSLVMNRNISIVVLYDTHGASFALLDEKHKRCRKIDVRELTIKMAKDATEEQLLGRADDLANRLHSLLN